MLKSCLCAHSHLEHNHNSKFQKVHYWVQNRLWCLLIRDTTSYCKNWKCLVLFPNFSIFNYLIEYVLSTSSVDVHGMGPWPMAPKEMYTGIAFRNRKCEKILSQTLSSVMSACSKWSNSHGSSKIEESLVCAEYRKAKKWITPCPLMRPSLPLNEPTQETSS